MAQIDRTLFQNKERDAKTNLFFKATENNSKIRHQYEHTPCDPLLVRRITPEKSKFIALNYRSTL